MMDKRLSGKSGWRWFGVSLLGGAVVALSGLAGCGGHDGVARYDLSGEVRYDGKPVPRGYLRFVPDRSQGNHGPGASAAIQDGHYQTLSKAGMIGGPQIVKIVGTDGIPFKTKDGATIPTGRPLFTEYEFHIDFPRESGTHDFVVPVHHGRDRRSKKGG